MKVMTVVGARPQFIKAAAVSRVLRSKHTEILVHTGQHYDANMSQVFFDELDIPKPDYNLGVGSGSHGKQTGLMLIKLEELIFRIKPDFVLVYGDTNSTLAGALAASKQLIPLAHVEAGLRSYNRAMPEEINRVLTDHVSERLFCPTATAVDNLAAEGVRDGVYNVGDVMCDALMYNRELSEKKYAGAGLELLEPVYGDLPSREDGYYLATVHRAENTDGETKLSRILSAFERLDSPVVFPVHPRTMELVCDLCRKNSYRNILFSQPVGYLYMLYLAGGAKKIITDSGGLQKEAYLMGVPCVTVRPQTEWVETLRGGWNTLSCAESNEIIEKVLNRTPAAALRENYYGDGRAAEKICGLL